MIIELQISNRAERYEVKSMFIFEATVEQAEFELQLQHAINAVQRQADSQLQRAQWQADSHCSISIRLTPFTQPLNRSHLTTFTQTPIRLYGHLFLAVSGYAERSNMTEELVPLAAYQCPLSLLCFLCVF